MNHKIVCCCVGILVVAGLCLLGGCAGINPNPGMRTAEAYHYEGKHEKELAILKNHAGNPWAQLYLGMVYESGDGVETNYTQALEWYLRTALQHGQGRWADGEEFFSVGERGYYGANCCG